MRHDQKSRGRYADLSERIRESAAELWNEPGSTVSLNALALRRKAVSYVEIEDEEEALKEVERLFPLAIKRVSIVSEDEAKPWR